MSSMHIKQKNAQNYVINSTTHNREEKKYKNSKKKITELYLRKESTYVETDEKIHLFESVQGDERRHTKKPSRMDG